jgi:hypothetical protein
MPPKIFFANLDSRKGSSLRQGVTVGRGGGPKIACFHRKAESSIILHCTAVHAVINSKVVSNLLLEPVNEISLEVYIIGRPVARAVS